MNIEANHPCFACHSKLEQVSQVRADCTNPACPGGRVFTICGFCKKFSFAVKFSYCFNPNCRLYKKKRTVCPICNKMSVITYHGRPLCINRQCPSNRKNVTKCFFCNNESFLKSPHAMFCTKGDCPYLLERVYECFHCGELSFVEKEARCKNPGCQYYDVEMALCPYCHKRTRIVDSNHPHHGRCSNPECSDYFEKKLAEGAVAEAPPADIGSTIAIPLQELQQQMAKETEEDVGEPQPAAPVVPEKMDTIAVPMSDIGEVGPAPAAPESASEPAPFGTAAEELTPEKLFKEAQAETPPPTPPPKEAAETVPVDWDSQEEAAPVTQQPPPIQSPATEPKPEPSSGVHELGEELRKEIMSESPEEETEEPPSPRKREEKVSSIALEKPVQLPDGEVLPKPSEDEWSFEASVGQAAPSVPQEAPSSVVSLEDVYDFIDEYVLRSSDGRRSPTFVVVGLPGSGKTSYLTMLGAILLLAHQQENRIFYFPYEVSVGWLNASTLARKVLGKTPSGKRAELAKAIEAYVRDLAQDFAREHYFNYIEHMLFPPHTPVSAEGTGQISGTFLIAELQKAGKTAAKIATLEISGEDVKFVLARITSADAVKRLRTAEQRVFLRLLERSRGYVILVDAGSVGQDDQLYQPLFMVLRDELRKRFFTRLRMLVDEELRKIAAERGEGATDVTRIFQQVKAADEEERQRIESLNKTAKSLKEQITKMRQAVTKEGPEVVLGEKAVWHPLYRRLTDWLENEPEADVLERMGEHAEGCLERHKKRRGVYQENRAKLSQALQSATNRRKVFASYIEWLCGFILKPENFKDLVFYSVIADELRRIRSDYEEAVQRVLERYNIPLSYGPAISELAEVGESERFKDLRYIAIVITKTDSHKIVYPPERFAEQQMVASNQYLRDIQMYLRVFGGYIRFYNASVAGYSIQIDTTNYVAPRATLTPINVVEPFFDMLVAEGLIKDVREA